MYFTQVNPKKRVVLLVLAGAFAFSIPTSGEAHRQHDPQVEAKVETQQHINAGRSIVTGAGVQEDLAPSSGTRSIRERIDAILHPEAHSGAAGIPSGLDARVNLPGSPVQVPATVSAYDHSIIGTPMATQQQCVEYLLRVNPHPAITVSPEQLVAFYYEEGAREGIRPDVAFAQALKETGFFRYGGTVTPDQNNYCGLGTTSAVVKGAYFATSQMGVRAHIQHLLAYAATRAPQENVVDPRYKLVRDVYGESTLGNWEDLNGRWAVPGYSYGQSILSMFRDILRI